VECHEKESGALGVIDENNTWQQIQEKLPYFVENIAGKDLADVAYKESQHLYLQMVKKGLNKVSKLKGKPEEKHLHAMLTAIDNCYQATANSSPSSLGWNLFK